jgi:hypothetical protein
MHRLHQREVAQRDGRKGGRNHRTLHVIKGVCAWTASGSFCTAKSSHARWRSLLAAPAETRFPHFSVTAT